MSYSEFVARKGAASAFDGIDAIDADLADLFPFQADLVRWALRRGRACLFADTGLGKTRMQIRWASAVAQRGRVLILAPLAVADQTVRESQSIGTSVRYLRADDGLPGIVITNYDMLDHFDAESFVGVVLDESSILKSFTGSTRNEIIEKFAGTPYRLACTATPAPNDFTELGNHSEFLGIKTRTEMLAEYFVHDGGSTHDWRLKGHAASQFWRWVCSWGAMVKSPADIGYNASSYVLPPLRMHERVVRVDHSDAWSEGMLFAADAVTLADQRAVRRATADRRIAIAAELATAGPCLIWGETNDECDAVTAAIPDAVQVAGSDSLQDKRDRLIGFADGRYRVLVTKPKIAGFGMNWQHCRRMVFMGASHSFEATYQAIRRCWRFGQTDPVDVYVIRAETEQAIIANFQRKEADAARMYAGMREFTVDAMRAAIGGGRKEWNEYNPSMPMRLPYWM